MSSEMERVQSLQKMQVLTRQKANLAAQLEVANETNGKLLERLDAHETEQAAVKAAVSAVTRLWEELNADIRILAHRRPQQENGAAAAEPRGLVKGEVDGGSTGVVDGHTGDAPEDGPGCDPFLRALTRGGDPKALKLFAGAQAELDAKATEAEQALRRRADATKAALAALLQRMDADRQRFESRLADAAPAETAEDLRRLQLECREARERADAQTAVARSAAAQLAQAEAAVERADKKVDELKGQLSDRDSELAAAQRKLVAARDSATAADVNATHLASQASLGVPGTPRGIAHALSRGAGSFNEHLQGAAATAAAAAATSMMADMQREIEGLKETLAARTAELDAEREVVLKLRREAAGGLGGALSQAPDDAAVRESAASRAQAAEVARLSELAAAREAEVARLRQSAAALEAQAQHAAVLDMATRRQQQQLEEYGARIVDLEARLRDADALRDRLQRQADADAAARGDPRTVAQLLAQLAEVSTRAATVQRQADRQADLAARQAAMSAEAAAARTELQAKELTLQRATERAAQQEAQLAALQASAAELEAQVADLRLFVDVLLAAAPELRPLAELQAAQARLIRDLEAAQAQLHGGALEKAQQDAIVAKAAAAEALRAAHAERDAALVQAGSADRRAVQLEAELSDAKAEVDAFISEIESTGTAFEQMRERNQILLDQLTSRDETNASVTSERLRVQQHAERLAKERDEAVQRSATAETSARTLHGNLAELEQRLMVRSCLKCSSAPHETSARTLHGNLAELEQRLMAVHQELAAVRQQQAAAESRAEALGVDLRAREAELAVMKESALQLAKELGDNKRKAAEELENLERERTKRRRLEEDNKGLQVRLEKLRQAGLDGVRAEVEQELEHMRTLMRCSVCKVRQKDTVISKCWHMFCQQCIQANLSNRHRKCPGCSAAFGAADVHQVFLT